MMTPPTYHESYCTRRTERGAEFDSYRHSRAARKAAREAENTGESSERVYGKRLRQIFARAPHLVRFGYLSNARHGL